jgi:beta-glucosidase
MYPQAWYQGQEQGNCLADVLLGLQDPSGKLPLTFPRHLEDNPSFYNHPGGNDRVVYGEGIFVGYRHYDMIKSEPLFPFGFGLSYTTWSYSNLQLSSGTLDIDQEGNGAIEVTVEVANTGDRPGKEIVQFYVHQVTKPRLIRPPRELKGFSKVSAMPGQTVTARATLDRVSVSYWDDGTHRWTVDPNATFMVTAAKDSRDLGISASFQMGGGFHWIH